MLIKTNKRRFLTIKKSLLALSVSALILSLSGVASASPVDQTKNVVAPASEMNLVVTWKPVDGGMQILDTNGTIYGIGGKYEMVNGSNWLLWSGSTYVKVNGNIAIGLQYGGPAQIGAYKGDGSLLGWYFITVVR